MAPGFGLEIPKLAAECLEPFRPQASNSSAFTLAHNLLLTGIGAPDDWEQSNRDPVNFMLRTVKRTAAGFDQRVIDGVAHTNVVFGTYPSALGWRRPEEDQKPDRVYVAVEATHISVVYLRETFELLAKADPRLPATFYWMLLESLSRWILCYDESAVESYYEYRMESYEEAKASGEGEEGLEKPQTIEDAKGPWLAPQFKPWPARHVSNVIASAPQCPRVQEILKAAARLLNLSRKRKRSRPDWKALDECFPGGCYTIPFSIIAFHEQDLICEAFQFDEQDWLNGGEEPSPAFFSILDPDDGNSIKAAFDDLKHFLSMMEALGQLSALLPGADLLEVQT
jgi:hypothetical protein